MRRALIPLLVALVCLAAPGPAQADPGARFEHAMWQWYEASGISQARMDAVAPHFPHPQGSSAVDRDLQRYNDALLRWTYLYPHEYEAFVNAPELTALNPYYREYVRVVRRPHFMDVAVKVEAPEMPAAGASFEESLYYELQLMKWTFLFQPEAFVDVYGFSPMLPEGLDEKAWRALEIERARERAKADEDPQGEAR